MRLGMARGRPFPHEHKRSRDVRCDDVLLGHLLGSPSQAILKSVREKAITGGRPRGSTDPRPGEHRSSADARGAWARQQSMEAASLSMEESCPRENQVTAARSRSLACWNESFRSTRVGPMRSELVRRVWRIADRWPDPVAPSPDSSASTERRALWLVCFRWVCRPCSPRPFF